MAYFSHAYQKIMIGNSLKTTVGSLTDLTAGQLGVVGMNHNTIEISDLTTASYATHPMVYLAQGSFHTVDEVGMHSGYLRPVKSKGINPKYVSKVWVSDAKVAQNNIWHVCSDNCNLECDTTYRLRIDVKGSRVLGALQRNLYFNVDAYTGCCTDDPIDPITVLLQWANGINENPLGKPFVQASVVGLNSLGDFVVSVNSGTITATVSDNEDIVPEVGNVLQVDDDYYVIATVEEIISDDDEVTGWTITVKEYDWLTGETGSSTATLDDMTDETLAMYLVPDSDDDVTGWVITVKEYDWLTGETGSSTATLDDMTDETLAMYLVPDMDNYEPLTDTTAISNSHSCLVIESAYVDTKFGNCSYSKNDRVDIEPVIIKVSILDETGDPCVVNCFKPTEIQEAHQGAGYGETLLQEYILSKSYEQEFWEDDPRYRETKDQTFNTDVDRTAKYKVLNILHSVPRKSNPSGTFDNDQYLIRILFKSTFDNSALITWLNAYLTSANSGIQVETTGY